MRRLVREERGVTLPEVLVVSVVMIVVLGAVLGAFETFQKTTATNQRLNDVQDSVRVAIDAMTRELRNMASPVDSMPDSILRKDPQDLAFLSVAGQKPAGSLNSRNTRRVRYCLSPDKKLFRMEQTWVSATPPSVPAMTSCTGADTGWTTTRVMSPNVTNAARPLFTYNNSVSTRVTEVAVSLYVDPHPGFSPTEVGLQSAVFLRNQNRAPVAEFDMQPSGNSVVLNASQSSDPEGRALNFYWYDEARTGVSNICTVPAGISAAGCVGTGLVFSYTPPTTNSNRTMHLVVSDGNLTSQSASQTKCVGVCSP